MNELLQRHGCSNVFSVPEGLRELMADITREVLREQPPKLYDFITNYLSALLITREHGLLSTRILDELCDCRPSVSEHLLDVGVPENTTRFLAEVIHAEIEAQEPEPGKEVVKESNIVKKVLQVIDLDEETTAKVCQVARNAFRDYWYRKELLSKKVKEEPCEPWERAAENTLRIYKSTKPTFSELNRAAKVIQAAYRGYHVRSKTLRHLKVPRSGRQHRGDSTPADIAGSREIDLGPMLHVQPSHDDVNAIFDEVEGAPERDDGGVKMLTYNKSKQSKILFPGPASSCTLPKVIRS